jgi:hypothetical protein
LVFAGMDSGMVIASLFISLQGLDNPGISPVEDEPRILYSGKERDCLCRMG